MKFCVRSTSCGTCTATALESIVAVKWVEGKLWRELMGEGKAELVMSRLPGYMNACCWLHEDASRLLREHIINY